MIVHGELLSAETENTTSIKYYNDVVDRHEMLVRLASYIMFLVSFKFVKYTDLNRSFTVIYLNVGKVKKIPTENVARSGNVGGTGDARLKWIGGFAQRTARVALYFSSETKSAYPIISICFPVSVHLARDDDDDEPRQLQKTGQTTLFIFENSRLSPGVLRALNGLSRCPSFDDSRVPVIIGRYVRVKNIRIFFRNQF